MTPRRPREFDQATAHAVALMTLYVGTTADDDTRAGTMLDEFLAMRDGPHRTVAGFETLCGALLVLLELETGVTPEAVLQRVGAMIASDGCLA